AGTPSGKPWFVHPQRGTLVPEVCGDEMSVGMTKFYRVACFKEIGGFVRQVMWDGIDCHRCRMFGWIAESRELKPIRFVHLRPQGASQKGIWTGRLRAGFGQYFMGTSPLYYLAVVIYRLSAHPAVIGSVAMLWGYLRSWFKGLPRYDDPDFRCFLRYSTYLPHGHHGQRLPPVHDAPRPGAGAGLQGRPTHSCRRHVGGVGSQSLWPTDAGARDGYRPDGASLGGSD